MSLLLDYLRVPMAAPETPMLRALRASILVGCLVLAASLVTLQFVGPVELRAQLVGLGVSPGAARMVVAAGVGAVIGLLFALVPIVPTYVMMKNRADDAYLSAIISGGSDA